MTKPTYTYQIELWNGNACADAWYPVEKHEGITDELTEKSNEFTKDRNAMGGSK